MRLRARFTEEINARLAAHLPEAAATAWSGGGVVCVIEQLKFAPSGGDDGAFEMVASFEGMLVVQLIADGVDALPVEELIGDLVAAPPVIKLDPDAQAGALTEGARAQLVEVRDATRDATVATTLRFGVKGYLARRLAPGAPTPDDLTIQGDV